MRSFLLRLIRRRSIEQDMQAELEFHREMARANGNPIPLGNQVLIREQGLDLWRFNLVENLWRDLCYSLRALRRSPGFVLSALLSLGLGIGVNATMFSLAVSFLLSEPSVSNASEWRSLRFSGNSHMSKDALEFVREGGAFADMIGENEESFINWNNGQETRRVFALQGTRNYFTALGIPMALGRGWSESDPQESAVLRYQFWMRNLNGDPSIVGKSLSLDGRSYFVTGVLREDHRTLTGFGFSPDIYVPVYLPDTFMAAYGRIKPDHTPGQTRSALQMVAQRLDQHLPDRYVKYASGFEMSPVSGFARLNLDPQSKGVGAFFGLLLGMVGLVLLVACVNVAGLLLARASVRQQEIAIRLSLGASKMRLFQQLLTESLLLSLAGAALGFLFAVVASKMLSTISLPIPLPISLQIEPDWRVVAYAALLAGISTIATGLLPSWQALRESFSPNLHRERKVRLRRLLVIAQIALSLVVLTTAALFLRNLLRSATISPGFDVRNTLRAEVHLPPLQYAGSERIREFVDTAEDKLRALPGIQFVAAARLLPFTDRTTNVTDFAFLDRLGKLHVRFDWNAVGPEYFQAMDIPLVAGRPFTQLDRDKAPRVAIVNSKFVSQFLGTANPIGLQFKWGDGQEVHEIVGVVKPTKSMTIGEEERPQVYQPITQIDKPRSRMQFVLRSAIPPPEQLVPVRNALYAINKGAGLEVQTLYSSIGLAFLPSQVGAGLMGSIGVLGLLLTAIGLYGVMSYSVARRTREIGIRVAIGASWQEISQLIFYDAARLVLIGSAIGLAIAVLVVQPLSVFMAEGFNPLDPASFAVVLLVIACTGIGAVFGPVKRAIAVEPSRALKWE